jgi:hypothetical protein
MRTVKSHALGSINRTQEGREGRRRGENQGEGGGKRERRRRNEKNRGDFLKLKGEGSLKRGEVL